MVLDSNIFPGFRHAFEPAQIPWDIDPAPLKQRAVDIEKGKIKSTLYTSISQLWICVSRDLTEDNLTRRLKPSPTKIRYRGIHC